jgi:hypothetical protein
LNYRIEQLEPHVINIHIDVPSVTNFEQWFLISADRHHDNLHANHEMELKHLKQAVDREAGILDFGDLSCAMQGKWDKRADQTQMREELRTNKYLDSLVEYNADFYTPFAKNFAVMSPGNHETSILRHHQTNLAERIVERLKAAGSDLALGTYSGWVVFKFTINKTQRMSVRMFWHHGSGGGGPVTRGVIGTNRQAVFLPDAHIVVGGHIHEEWSLTIPRERITDNGRTYIDEQLHLRVPGYKEEYLCHEGYHIEGGRAPKTNGAAWLRFYVDRDKTGHYVIAYETLRAK